MKPRRESLEVECVGEVAVVRFSQSRILDTASVEGVGNELFDIVEGGATKLVLDFTGVEYLASAALGLLVRMHKTILRKRGAWRFCHVAPEIEKLFRISGLLKTFAVDPTRAEALAKLRAL